MKPPMQPIVMINGIARFQQNRYVQELLDANPYLLNGMRVDTDEDKEAYSQLMQLIGYSVSGWGGLDGANPEDVKIADRIVEEMGDYAVEQPARISNDDTRLGRFTDELTRTLLQIEAEIVKRKFSVPACVPLDDTRSLSFHKVGRKWGLYVMTDGKATWLPSTSRETRKRAVFVIHALVRELEEGVNVELNAVSGAVVCAKTLLEELRKHE